MRNYWLVLLLVLALLPIGEAATIQGSVYDVSLELLTDVKVGISTEPRQQLIAKNGTYSFEVPPGTYILTAFELKDEEIVSTVQENVVISVDGSFTLDLLLFPNFDEDLSFIEDVGSLSVEEEVVGGISITQIVLIVGAIVLIALVILVFFLHSSRKQSSKTPGLPEDLHEVIKIIKKEGGRISQKELRKHFPLSEGKVSLMVTDLESRGLIEKIKKGRGNIIRLK